MGIQKSEASAVQSSMSYGISAGLATLFWLGLAGVGVMGIVGSISVVIGVATFGQLVLRLLCPELIDPDTRVLVAVGPGFGVGLLILFLLRAVTGRELFLGLTVAIVLMSLVTELRTFPRNRLSTRLVELFKSPALPSGWMILGTIGIVGLILHREWWWNFPIVVVALTTGFVGRNVSSSRNRKITLLAGVILLVLASYWGTASRGVAWWVSSSNDDDAFFETWSHSLVQWGPLTNPSAVATGGLDVMSYHHLAYFFTGLVDMATGGKPFEALDKIVPVLLAVSSLGSGILFASLAARYSRASKPTIGQLLVGVTLFFALVSVTHPWSDFLATSLVIGVVAISPRAVASTSLTRLLFLSLLLVGSVAFSKTAYIYAPILALAASAWWVRRSVARCAIALISGALFIGFFRFFGLYSSVFSLEFLSGSMVGEHAVGGLGAQILAIIYVLMPLSLGLISSLLVSPSTMQISAARAMWTTLLLMMISGATFRMFVSTPEPRIASYLIRPSLIAVGLSVVAIFVTRGSMESERKEAARITSWTIVLTLSWLLVVRNFIPNLPSGSVWAKSFRMVRDAQFLALIALASLLVSRVVTTRARRATVLLHSLPNRRIPSAASLAIAISIVAGIIPIGERIQERWNETRNRDEDFLLNQKALGSESLFEVAMLIRNEADQSAIVAFSICDRECDPSGFREPNLLSAYSRRRFLHAVGLVYIWGPSNSEEAEDYDFSRNMLSLEPLDVHRTLKARDVSYLIVDRQRTSTDWVSKIERAGAFLKFVNDDFYLLKITS